MSIKPLHDFVLIKLRPAKETSAGGIVIPEKAQQQEWVADVVAVGPGFETQYDGHRTKMAVKKGDTVLLIGRPTGGRQYKDYLLIRQGDICAVLDE